MWTRQAGRTTRPSTQSVSNPHRNVIARDVNVSERLLVLASTDVLMREESYAKDCTLYSHNALSGEQWKTATSNPTA